MSGQLSHGASRTCVCSYWMDLGSGTELGMQVKELLFHDAYLSKVVDDQKSWFTQMEVLDLIYHQICFTANSLGSQRTTSQYFQPLTPQTVALVTTAIHCVLSEYGSGKKATAMISPDECQGILCPSLVINFTSDAPALINYTLVGHFLTPAPPSGVTPLGKGPLNPHHCSWA